jgi:leucokinin receptor
MAIALDRHRAVIHPLTARTSTLKSNIIIAFIWFVAIIFAIPIAVALKVDLVYDDETQDYTKPFCHNIGLEETLFNYYNYTLVVIQYVLPLIIITIAYIRIILRLNFDETQNNWRRDCTSNVVVIEQNKRKVCLDVLFLNFYFALFLCDLLFSIYLSNEKINAFYFVPIKGFF